MNALPEPREQDVDIGKDTEGSADRHQAYRVLAKQQGHQRTYRDACEKMSRSLQENIPDTQCGIDS
jgi:hypothetical protein